MPLFSFLLRVPVPSHHTLIDASVPLASVFLALSSGHTPRNFFQSTSVLPTRTHGTESINTHIPCFLSCTSSSHLSSSISPALLLWHPQKPEEYMGRKPSVSIIFMLFITFSIFSSCFHHITQYSPSVHVPIVHTLLSHLRVCTRNHTHKKHIHRCTFTHTESIVSHV